jgi:anaerobic selenocysteine-containing dehydrogenase
MSTRTVHTFCRYCLASCGVEVTVEDNRVTKISADKQNTSAPRAARRTSSSSIPGGS